MSLLMVVYQWVMVFELYFLLLFLLPYEPSRAKLEASVNSQHLLTGDPPFVTCNITDGECGVCTNITDLRGVVEFVSSPEELHRPNSNCSVNINAPSGFYLQLNFTELVVDKSEDKCDDCLLVTDGETSYRLKSDVNGLALSEPLRFSSNKVTARFTTDSNSSSLNSSTTASPNRWKATYTALSKNGRAEEQKKKKKKLTKFRG